jgi:hypothetical protein
VPTVQIEIRNPGNRGLLFKPTQTVVRGAIDFVSTKDPELYAYGMAFDGKTIPGKRIVLDTDKSEGAIYDPLAKPENDALAAKLRAKLSGPIKGSEITFAEPKKYEKVHAATWLYHMRRAVEAGHAVVVSGDINTPVDGEPQKEFLHKREKVADKRDETIDKLAELVKAQGEQIAKLLAAKK